MTIVEDKKPAFEKIIADLHAELTKLRTGRANPAMVEDLLADYYGAPMAIKQLASIAVPEPRQLLISAWDKNALVPIEKAVRDAGLGLNPVNEGDKIRISLPVLTEERRRELVKISNKIAEDCRIRVRNLREEILKDIKHQEEAGALTEDDRFRDQEKLQEAVDDYNAKIKDIAAKKEQEIMTV